MTPLPTFAQYVANEWRALRDEYGAAALRGLRAGYLRQWERQWIAALDDAVWRGDPIADAVWRSAARVLRPADLPRLRCRHDNALSARQRHAP